jgi:hypothetical protein
MTENFSDKKNLLFIQNAFVVNSLLKIDLFKHRAMQVKKIRLLCLKNRAKSCSDPINQMILQYELDVQTFRLYWLSFLPEVFSSYKQAPPRQTSS